MISDLIKYYQNLLIVQYHNKKTAKDEIDLAVRTFTGDNIIPQIVFDVDTSVGKQLDLIGKIVGLSRIAVGFTFANRYFSYNDYDDPMSDASGRGYSDVGSPVEASFKEYSEATKYIYSMSDGQYRKMIRLKILANNGIATNRYVDDSLYQLFRGGVKITDNEDMTVTITVQPAYEFEGRLAEFLGLMPKPLGVGAIINYL